MIIHINNNFYKKAKEKTEKNGDNKDEEKIMKIIKENEEIKKENFDFIKDLDKLAELQETYQDLVEENKKLKVILKDCELNEGEKYS